MIHTLLGHFSSKDTSKDCKAYNYFVDLNKKLNSILLTRQTITRECVVEMAMDYGALRCVLRAFQRVSIPNFSARAELPTGVPKPHPRTPTYPGPLRGPRSYMAAARPEKSTRFPILATPMGVTKLVSIDRSYTFSKTS